jgi:hypothetical protein
LLIFRRLTRKPCFSRPMCIKHFFFVLWRRFTLYCWGRAFVVHSVFCQVIPAKQWQLCCFNIQKLYLFSYLRVLYDCRYKQWFLTKTALTNWFSYRRLILSRYELNF